MIVKLLNTYLFLVLMGSVSLVHTALNSDEREFELALERNTLQVNAFRFISNGIEFKARIYIPDDHLIPNDLPVLYLIDFTEQHFKLARDEFETLVEAVEAIDGFRAMVVSLQSILDIDAEPESFDQDYRIYRDMVSHVDSVYSNNSLRTFVGKGSESGLVLKALFIEDKKSSIFDNYIVTDPSPLYRKEIVRMIEEDDYSPDKNLNKLHFSFSKTNDRQACLELIQLIEESNFPWLECMSVEYSDSYYENTYPSAYSDGIKYLFKK